MARIWLLALVGIAISAGAFFLLPGRLGACAGALFGLAVAAGCWITLRSILKPVGEIAAAMQEAARSMELRAVAVGWAPREVRALGDAFGRFEDAIREQLIQSDRLATIGRLAAGVAHEINNPLGSILLFARLTLEQSGAEGRMRENLERIEKETLRCHRIVEKLLDFARQREPRMEQVDIHGLLDESVQFLERQNALEGVRVIRRYAPALPEIPADPLELGQVFMNIMINALDAMEGKGTLTLETAEEAGGAAIAIHVSDDGIGIPPENLERIFDPFFTTKEVGRGTGLGLSVSYGIVQAHGGEIRVRSTPGEGSRFTVRLPVSKRGA